MASFYEKICDRSSIVSKVAGLPKPVVLTNGVFDILHRGHVTYLEQARAMGASLVVAVNTDDSVRRLGKGDDRPINTCEDRMAVLAALESVSAVVPFGEDTAQAIVRECRPDIYVKGGKCFRMVDRSGRSTSSTTVRRRHCWKRSDVQNKSGSVSTGFATSAPKS